MRQPRRVTSGTWASLSAEARADLHASESTTPLLDAVIAVLGTSVDLSGEAERYLRALLQSARRESFLAGSAREADLVTALDAQKAICRRHRQALREAGIRLPQITET